VLWALLRVSGLVKKVLQSGKSLKVQIGRRELIHLKRKDGNLSLEVLPIGKNILVRRVGRPSKKDLILRVKEKIQAQEELDTRKIINRTLYSNREKLDSSRRNQLDNQEREKEGNIKNGTSS
jgi:hypothetical protein